MADSTLHSRYHSRKEEGETVLFSHGFVLFVFVPRNNKLEDIRLVAELDVATRTEHIRASVLYRWRRVDFSQRNLRHVYSICANNRRLNKQLPVSRIIFIVPFPPSSSILHSSRTNSRHLCLFTRGYTGIYACIYYESGKLIFHSEFSTIHIYAIFLLFFCGGYLITRLNAFYAYSINIK